jgi:hypothetical protein
MLSRSVRRVFFLLVAAWIFALFSCDSSGPDVQPEALPPDVPSLPASVKRVELDSAGNGTITLTVSPDEEVYLVKANTSSLPRSNASVAPPSVAGSAWSADENGIRVPAGTVTIDGQTLVRYERQWQIEMPPPSQTALTANRRMASVYTDATTVGASKLFYLDAMNKQATATLKYVGTYCKVWVVNANFNNTSVPNNDNQVTLTQIETLGQKFDDIYQIETKLLGYEYGGGPQGNENKGADGDSKIQILVYDIDGDFKNHQNGITMGYFFSADEYSNTEIMSQYPYSNIRSNEAEIFYLDCEMLDGKPTDIYTTLIHEFNHMINFNRKVLVNGQISSWNNETWYTEMLSMLAEDAIGPLVGIDKDSVSHVINMRIPSWILSYDYAGPMQWKNNNDVLYYYASNYAFGAYLVRNFGGPKLLEKIAKSPKGGRASLDEILRELNSSVFSGFSGSPSQYALTRFGEALVYSGAKKPSGAYTFDKEAKGTIEETEYTFAPFDIWTITTEVIINKQKETITGPWVYEYVEGDKYNIQPYTNQLFSHDSWKNQTGNLTIEVRGGNPYTYYFAITK